MLTSFGVNVLDFLPTVLESDRFDCGLIGDSLLVSIYPASVDSVSFCRG